MGETVKETKIGFFKKLKLAIFNLEEYGIFLGERFRRTLGFLAILILILSLCTSFAENYSLASTVNNYINNEMPGFTYNDGVLISEEVVEAYDEKFNFRFFVNTNDNVSEDTIKGYEKQIGVEDMSVLLLKDKAVLYGYALKEDADLMTTDVSNKDLYELTKQEMTFKDMQTMLTGEGFSNKEEFAQIIQETIIPNLFATTILPVAGVKFIFNFIQMFGDVCVVAIVGYVAALFLGVRFKMTPMLSLATYSMTLSFVLKGIYECANIVTGINVEYFDVVYLVIGYIYIVAAIFMVKYDLIKQREELEKIMEVQKEVQKELQNEKDNEVDNNDKNDEADEVNEDSDSETKEDKPEEEKEPDGSEI